jgi:hypothetical protein
LISVDIVLILHFVAKLQNESALPVLSGLP